MSARNYPPVIERFITKIDKSDDSGCWIWRGTYFQGKNRGAFWMEGRLRLASRVSWELLRGPIPDGKMICHHCDNGRCVNPDHLYIGDQKSNMRDRQVRNRTNRWDKRYNFVQTPELEEKVRTMRVDGMRIADICSTLGIGRTTYYRMANRGVIGEKITREAARANYCRVAQNR